MKEIVIIGAGGLGIGVAWLARRCGRKIKGFLDDTPEKHGSLILDIPVLGRIETRDLYLDCEYIIALGNPRNRKKIVDTFFSSKNYSFATLIDPSALLGENIEVEEGSMIWAGSILTVNVKVGQHCIVHLNSTLSHGTTVNNFVTISPNVSISGDVSIGDIVEIGANAVLKEKLSVGNGAVVGMGAVVTNNVTSHHVVVGNPAKVLKILN